MANIVYLLELVRVTHANGTAWDEKYQNLIISITDPSENKLRERANKWNLRSGKTFYHKLRLAKCHILEAEDDLDILDWIHFWDAPQTKGVEY